MNCSRRDRVDRLDVSLFNHVDTGGASSEDVRSLLALHAALAARGDFDYLEVGSYVGGNLQALLADPRCRKIMAVDRRDAASLDWRGRAMGNHGNTAANIRRRLSDVPGAELGKLITIDASTEDLDPAAFGADLCLIDVEHTDAAALRDARFCRRVIRDRGVIVFHDRLLVQKGIRAFLGELPHARAYPLSHDLLVVEVGVPSLLSDRRVRAQVPRPVWLIITRLGVTREALQLSSVAKARLQPLVDGAKHLVGRTRSWNLDALGVLWGTDKAPGYHGYTRYYARHLRARRRAVRCVLEIGIGGYDRWRGGDSLRMWRNYFPRATIYGLDLYEKRFADARRLVALQGDQSDPDVLHRVLELCPAFDLVIDDGSHIRSHVIASFEALFPAVKPGGVYAIEDLDAVYRASHSASCGTSNNAAAVAKQLFDDLDLDRRPVAAVHAYAGLVLVEKGGASEHVQ